MAAFHVAARPEFDPTTGFFKTIIWRAGIGNRVKGPSRRGLVSGPSYVGPKKRAQETEGPSQGPSRGASQGLVRG